MQLSQIILLVALFGTAVVAFPGYGHSGLNGYGHADNYIFLLVVAMAAAAYAFPPAHHYGGASQHGHHDVDYYAHPQYNYKYGVHDQHTGDVKNQWESRDGDVVKGSYSLHEADGTIRQVDYTADDHSGFNAVVSRIGKAAHPQHYVVAHDAQPLIALGHYGAPFYAHGNNYALHGGLHH